MEAVRKIILLVAIAFLLAHCSKDREFEISSVKGEFDVSFQTDLKNTIYTSAVFGLTEVEQKNSQNIEFFYINFNAETEGVIEIIIEESSLNYKTEIIQKVSAGQNIFSPQLKWKYDVLKQMSQPGNTDISFVCKNTAGEELGSKNIKVRYTSINECVLVAQLNSVTHPLLYMVGAYINENSPIVDKFLKDVLETSDLEDFTGYEGEDENTVIQNVINQVRAMFLTLRSQGVKYRGIAVGNNSSNPNIISQHIHFADEIMNNPQANCVDGTVFLCSALQKVGIESFMVFEPGHVYLGYYAYPNKKYPFLLETVLVGTDFSFVHATDMNVDRFKKNIDKYDNGDFTDMYFLIHTNDIRSLIKPIGR